MIDWPQSLLAEVAERRCVLVLGSGVSASAVNAEGQRPPGWVQFLTGGANRIGSEDDREEALRLIPTAPLDSAQIIADSLGNPDFAAFLRGSLDDPNFMPSELHKEILRIDPKIIVTTNYDTILDGLATSGPSAPAYNICRYYETHLVDDLRSDRRLILKAHGCVTNPHKVVLTRRQYFESRRQHPEFFAALDAIFLTSTLLFIGSGFNGDPDIELLLQNTFISAPSAHPHYAVVEDGRHQSVAKAIQDTHNVKFLAYPAGEHGQVLDAVRRLADDVEAYRAVGLA